MIGCISESQISLQTKLIYPSYKTGLEIRHTSNSYWELPLFINKSILRKLGKILNLIVGPVTISTSYYEEELIKEGKIPITLEKLIIQFCYVSQPEKVA